MSREALVDLGINFLKIQWRFLDKRKSLIELIKLNKYKFATEEAISFITHCAFQIDENEIEINVEYVADASVVCIYGDNYE